MGKWFTSVDFNPHRTKTQVEKANNWYAAGVIAQQLRKQGHAVAIHEVGPGRYEVHHYKKKRKGRRR